MCLKSKIWTGSAKNWDNGQKVDTHKIQKMGEGSVEFEIQNEMESKIGDEMPEVGVGSKSCQKKPF